MFPARGCDGCPCPSHVGPRSRVCRPPANSLVKSSYRPRAAGGPSVVVAGRPGSLKFPSWWLGSWGAETCSDDLLEGPMS